MDTQDFLNDVADVATLARPAVTKAARVEARKFGITQLAPRKRAANRGQRRQFRQLLKTGALPRNLGKPGLSDADLD
jgi:hypothetical protein